jgi:ComF family protein
MELSFLWRIKETLVDFLFPRKCILCQAYLEPEEYPLCRNCEQLMPWTGQDCRQNGVWFNHCISPLFYSDEVKHSFHRYKFHGHWHYNWQYGEWMWNYLQEYDPDYPRFDCISWAPLSFIRRQTRGYDQAQRLALAVSKASGLSLERTLVKIKHTPPQSRTSGAEVRRKNVEGVYAVKQGFSCTGKRILLVDDIITTGSTLEQAAKTLREAGAAEVCCLTLARGKL